MRKRSQFQIDTETEKYKAKLEKIYIHSERTPEFYYWAGKSFRSRLEHCRESKWKETIVSIKETAKRHRDALKSLGLQEHASHLMKGFEEKVNK